MNATDRTPDGKLAPIAEYLINRDGDYLVEALQRHRAQDPNQLAIKAAMMLLVGLYALSLWPLATEDLIVIAAGCMAVVAVLKVPYLIQYRALRQKFRKLPEGPATFRLSIGPDGVFSRSAALEARSEWSASSSPWSAYERAVALPDGILLYRATEGVQWLPDAALVDGSRADAEEVIRAHLPCRVSRARSRSKLP